MATSTIEYPMTSSEVTLAKQCDCKGIRTCLVCESGKGASYKPLLDSPTSFYVICCNCGAMRQQPVSSDISLYCSGNVCLEANQNELLIENLVVEGSVLDGIYLVKEFLSPSEEIDLLSVIDTIDWKKSQSGRRKQNYGPKVNFKRKKLKIGEFTGLPAYAEMLVKRINCLKSFDSYFPVEFCNLEYTPETGAAIDPHFDDKWVWGDRLISISTLSDSVITFYSQDFSVQVALPLPRRSFLGFWGTSR